MADHSTLSHPSFPRSQAYHPQWIINGISGGANPLWLTEWLCQILPLKPGMRVLDLGCGRALSSIFLHREYGVQVWATDLWFSPEENRQRIQAAGADGAVFPFQADARNLPFAPQFFDAVISIDAFMYFGTDDLYLDYLSRFMKQDAWLGIAMSGFRQELQHPVPAHLTDWFAAENPYCLHSAQWWKAHWQKTRLIDVVHNDAMTDGGDLWRQWLQIIAPDNRLEQNALLQDANQNLTYIRVAGKRTDHPTLMDPELRIPAQYEAAPLLNHH